jgi:hypothetical protein
MPDVFSAFVPVKPWPAILKKRVCKFFPRHRWYSALICNIMTRNTSLISLMERGI